VTAPARGLATSRLPVRPALFLAAALIAAISVPAILHYSTDMTIARHRIATGSKIATTPCGTIEYAVAGQGTPVLMIHGAGGGFDQGLSFVRPLLAHDIQLIAPSRFGYLRTPVPADTSAEAQADAHACLLDALGVERVVVMGGSAGAPSAIQLCIRHAERCRALILAVPAAYSPAHVEQTMDVPPGLEFVFNHVLTSDPALWLLTRLSPALLVRSMLATPESVFRSASASEHARAIRILDEVQPVSARKAGLQIDAQITSHLPRYELERITAPTLLISVEDDLFGTFENARYTASQIPGSKLVSYPDGGHIWLGHDDEVQHEIAQFVTSLAP